MSALLPDADPDGPLEHPIVRTERFVQRTVTGARPVGGGMRPVLVRAPTHGGSVDGGKAPAQSPPGAAPVG